MEMKLKRNLKILEDKGTIPPNHLKWPFFFSEGLAFLLDMKMWRFLIIEKNLAWKSKRWVQKGLLQAAIPQNLCQRFIYFDQSIRMQFMETLLNIL